MTTRTLPATWSLPRWRRMLIAVALGVAIAGIILLLGTQLAIALRQPLGDDAAAYWQAGDRLRLGEPLWPSWIGPDEARTYRYAPWFAFMWVPLTVLPHDLVVDTWVVGMLAASAWVLWTVAQQGRAGVILAVLFSPILLQFSLSGNIQALIVASLLWGVERRSGPLWIAAAASLKFTPLAFALVYLGRGEWRKVLITVGLTGALWLPALLFDLRFYPTETSGREAAPLILIALAAGISAVCTTALARTRYGWLAAGVTAMLALPRAHVYNMTFLLATARAPAAKNPSARPDDP